MTAMVTQRGGLEAFRKSWICGDCGGSNPVAVRECEDCGQARGQTTPRTAQAVTLNQQGNGSVVNNVLVVGGDMDNSDEHYHVSSPEPRDSYVRQLQPAPVYQEPRQLTGGEKALIAGANVATWASVFVLVPAAIFFVWLIAAGLAQVARVVPL